MKSQSKPKKIIWAVDPFSKNKELIQSSASAIRVLNQGIHYEIEPIYLFSSQIVEIPFEVSSQLTQVIQSEGQAILYKALEKVKLHTDLLPLKILPETSLSLTRGVEQLIQYAQEKQAALIVLATRSQKGPKRWLLGSFAETMILHSKIPLFIINPFWKRARQFKSILFPTDFSDASRKSFPRVLDLAKNLSAEILIFHKIKYEVFSSAELVISNYPIYQQAIDKELNLRRHEIQRLVHEAESVGVKAKIFINQKIEGSIAADIIRCIKSNSSIIAMTAHSSPIQSIFAGSVTREVIRSSNCPVWVIRSE